MTTGQDKRRKTPSRSPENIAPQNDCRDFIRAAAEDLRITGNKGQANPQADAHTASRQMASPAELRRSLWASPAKTNPEPFPAANGQLDAGKARSQALRSSTERSIGAARPAGASARPAAEKPPLPEATLTGSLSEKPSGAGPSELAAPEERPIGGASSGTDSASLRSQRRLPSSRSTSQNSGFRTDPETVNPTAVRAKLEERIVPSSKPEEDAGPTPAATKVLRPVEPAGQPVAAREKLSPDASTHPTSSAPYYGSSYYHGEPASEQGFLGSLNPLRVLRVIRRKWPMMLLVQVLAVAGAWFYLSTVPKTYRATSQIEMSLRRPRIMSQQGALIEDTSYAPSEEIFNTRLARFNGGEMRELAFTRFKALYPAKGQGDDKLRSLMGHATFLLINKTKLVQITCEHTDKALAPIVANAFMEAAELYSLEENRAASDKAVAWLAAQARTQRDSLEKSEQAIAQFRMQNNIDVLENKKKSLAESAMALGKSLVEHEGEVILNQDLVRKIDALEIKPETAGGIPDTIPRQAEIKAALERWGSAITERDSLLIRYTPQHPEVVAKNRVINLLRNQVEETINVARATALANLDLLQNQTASLRKKNTEIAVEAAQLDVKIVEANSRLTGLQRERDACDVAYRGILNRIEEARLAADENTASVQIRERAVEPTSPSKPNVLQTLLVAVLAGLGIGLGLALLTDTLEDRVSSAEDVERHIGLRIIGLVPHVPRALREDIVRTNLTDKRGHIAEVFAGIRVLLNSRQYVDHAQSVLVVSAGPEDGKTITACNLAIACAHGGMRTVLVDFDLRRPRIGRIFAIPDGARRLAKTLSERDPSRFEELPQPTACDNLHVISSRVVKNVNPSDIFGSGFVSDFLEWAKARYDRIIIDSPPFGAVSDCVVLASLVGSVIVVCRPVMTRKQATRFMLQNLTEVGANVIGAVINDVDFSKNPYFSNYYHQYHYTYSYGDKERKKASKDAAEEHADVPTAGGGGER